MELIGILLLVAKSEVRSSTLRQPWSESDDADDCERAAKSTDAVLVHLQLCCAVCFYVVVNFTRCWGGSFEGERWEVLAACISIAAVVYGID